MKRTFAALVALALLTACNNGTPTPSDSPSTDAPPAMSPAPSEPAANTPKSAEKLVIRFGALGPVSVGMSKEDALATGLFDADVPAPVDGCPSPPLTWKKPFNETADVLTKEDGSVASLGIHEKGPKTEDGIGVGSTLADLKSAYGDDLTGPEEAGYGQSGAYVEQNGAWIGFLLNPAPDAVTDDSAITFIEVSKGDKPGLMRDGC
jgi:hypothetical protein